MKFWPVAALCAILAAPAVFASSISPIDGAQRGAMVTVQGVVERITDEDEFRLADASGSIQVYVGPNWVPAEVGETVIVSGLVDDDPGPREIYARSLTRADGAVFNFNRRYD